MEMEADWDGGGALEAMSSGGGSGGHGKQAAGQQQPEAGALVEARFKAIRQRLDQLGYRQPLGIESLPLVDKLFR